MRNLSIVALLLTFSVLVPTAVAQDGQEDLQASVIPGPAALGNEIIDSDFANHSGEPVFAMGAGGVMYQIGGEEEEEDSEICVTCSNNYYACCNSTGCKCVKNGTEASCTNGGPGATSCAKP